MDTPTKVAIRDVAHSMLLLLIMLNHSLVLWLYGPGKLPLIPLKDDLIDDLCHQ